MSISASGSNITKSSNSIELFRGQSKDLELTITQVEDGEESALDLTGSTVYFTLKKKPGDAVALVSKTSASALDIEILSPAEDGIAKIYINPLDTSGLEADKYFFDVWVKLSSGKRFPVIEVSDFIIKEPITVVT